MPFFFRKMFSGAGHMCFAIGTFSQEFTRGGTKDVQIYLEETTDDDPSAPGCYIHRIFHPEFITG